MASFSESDSSGGQYDTVQTRATGKAEGSRKAKQFAFETES